MSSSPVNSEKESKSIQQNDCPEDADPYLVQFEKDDPSNPKNWTRARRWYLTVAGSVLFLNATFASSAPAGIVRDLIEEFRMSQEVASLTIGLFVAGFCVGPLLWGPISEVYGRRPVFIIPFIAYTGFEVGAALSRNTASLIIFRFLSGVCAAAPLTNSGGILADIWDASTRGKAFAIFTLSPFCGPGLAPLLSGYLSLAGVSWRWTFWILVIFAAVCLGLTILTIPETYPPVLLVQKARLKRKETGNNRYYAPLEKMQLPFAQRLKNILVKPFEVLFQEPMLIAIGLYTSFVYGCVYLLFEAYPVVYSEIHGFNIGELGLMYLPIPIGGALSVLLYCLVIDPRYNHAASKSSTGFLPPERRLTITVIGAPLLTISFFWFGWTSLKSISFWVPLASGIVFGFAICCIFTGLFNYVIDAYLFASASALASNTVMRSIFGAVFPLFSTQMYKVLGAPWASSLLGFFALLMTPIPLVLVKYGPALRKKSKYAPKLAI